MLRISAVYAQPQTWNGLPLADGLADIGGSLQRAADDLEELFADIRGKDVALLGAGARLADGLREGMASVGDFVLMRSRGSAFRSFTYSCTSRVNSWNACGGGPAGKF